MSDRQLGGRVREVVAPYIGVCPDLMEGGAQVCQSSCLEKLGNATQKEPVVVMVICTYGTGVGVVVLDGLKAG